MTIFQHMGHGHGWHFTIRYDSTGMRTHVSSAIAYGLTEEQYHAYVEAVEDAMQPLPWHISPTRTGSDAAKWQAVAMDLNHKLEQAMADLDLARRGITVLKPDGSIGEQLCGPGGGGGTSANTQWPSVCPHGHPRPDPSNGFCEICAYRGDGKISEKDATEIREAMKRAYPVKPITPPKRIGRTEREACVDALSLHYQAERITGDEFNERMSKAFAAQAQPELDALLADLPAKAVTLTPVVALTRQQKRDIGRRPGLSTNAAIVIVTILSVLAVILIDLIEHL